MFGKLLTVVLMLAATVVALGVSYAFAAVLSLGARSFAGWLFLACVVAIFAADALWMLRVFRPKHAAAA